MKKILIVVDMQNDFIDGALYNAEGVKIVPNVIEKINGFDGDIIATFDTHYGDYLSTLEGKKLPVEHCILGTKGHELNEGVKKALENKNCVYMTKYTFGTFKIAEYIKANYERDGFEIELIGLCTDICVVSNALILRAAFPNAVIKVDPSCCAGVTVESHNAALMTMRACQIDIEQE